MPANEPTEADIQVMASALGLTIDTTELAEVTHRFGALLAQLDRLNDLPLEDADPVAVFPVGEVRP